MNKYAALEEFLKSKKDDIVPLSFDDIEKLIEDALPPSARKYRAWWSNNPSNSVVTHAWRNAGYKTTDVRLEDETLVFRRIEKTGGAERPGGKRSILGCLKGTLTIRVDADLTEPAAPEWGASLDKAKLYND